MIINTKTAAVAAAAALESRKARAAASQASENKRNADQVIKLWKTDPRSIS
jgi:hypothetical protein